MIDKNTLHAAIDAGAKPGRSLKLYVGAGSYKTDISALHTALAGTPAEGWTLTRAEGGYRDPQGWWTTEPALVVEVISTDYDSSTDDAVVEAVARWAHGNGEKTILLVLNNGYADLFVSTLDLQSLLEASTVGV